MLEITMRPFCQSSLLFNAGIVSGVFLQGVFPYLYADIADALIRGCKELTAACRRNAQPVTGFKLHRLTINNSFTLAGSDEVDFLILFVIDAYLRTRQL